MPPSARRRLHPPRPMLAPASDVPDPGWSRPASCYGPDRPMPIAYLSEPPATADLVIVGGGILGTATAFHASRAGLRPLDLERPPALSTLTTAAAAGGVRLQPESRQELDLIGAAGELVRDLKDATGERAPERG